MIGPLIEDRNRVRGRGGLGYQEELVRLSRWSQWVDATLARSPLAEVSEAKVVRKG